MDVIKSTRPDPPAWLTRPAKALFNELTDDLLSAGVNLARVDRHSIAMASVCLVEMAAAAKDQRLARAAERKANGPKAAAKCRRDAQAASRALARYERDAQSWLLAIAATPVVRAKLGIKPKTKKAGAVATMLQARQRNNP